MSRTIRVVLCPGVEPFLADTGDLYLLPTADREQLLVPEPYGRNLHALLRAYDRGASPREAWAEVPERRRDPVSQYLSGLLEHGYARPAEAVVPDAGDSIGRYDRQIRFFAQSGQNGPSIQLRLADKKALIVGLGGVGGPIAEGLVRMGIGSLVGIDHDCVSEENLPRQTLYTGRDIGAAKAEAAQARLEEIADATSVVCLHQQIRSGSQLSELIEEHAADVLIVAADSPPVSIKHWSDQAAFTTGVPVVMGGQRPPHVFVGPFVIPGQTACFDCFMWDELSESAPELVTQLDASRDRNDFVVPAVGFADQTAASLMLSDVIGYLSGLWRPASLERQLQYDFRDFKQVWMPAGRQSCERCQRPIDAAQAA